jgi:hypothetical protein
MKTFRHWMSDFRLAIAMAALASGLTALADLVRVPLTVAEPAGIARSRGHVTSGVPFPMGALQTNAAFRLLDAGGSALPLQTQVPAIWRDGSIKWVLLDFQTDLAAGETRQFTLEGGGNLMTSPPPLQAIRIDDQPEALWVSTGPLRFAVDKGQFGVFAPAFLDLNRDGRFTSEERLPGRGLVQSLELAKEFAGWRTRVLPPDEVRVEERGPLRAVVRISGWIDDGTTNRLVRYLLRAHAFAGSSAVLVQHTVVQINPRIKMLWVKDLSLRLDWPLDSSAGFQLGGGLPEPHAGTLDAGAVTLAQLREGSYAVTCAGRTNAAGLHAAGWAEIDDGRRGVSVAVKDLWQQFPKAITVASNGLRLGLFPAEGAEPFDMDQGLAKTHDVLFDFHPAEAPADFTFHESRFTPPFAAAPSRWYCDSKVFGDVAPFDFDLFPDYETLTEASGDKFIKSMATGVRNWGDFYYGGPYKGKNAFMDLEYDVPHNFLVQFARTGQRKYLDAARRMAQHQADIDVNHFTKWQWKHSPRHTETQAEFGHTFTRGLLENWYLTGNRRCLEAAVELGDYFATEFPKPSTLGNERQIGWGLISLLPVYEATWDPKYIASVTNTLDRLIAGLDARGKFGIRWDNRIAFFNGIAATGFIYVHRATGDERVAEAALRVIRRTKGFYPEYSGRTLEALAWAYQRTRDPEYLDLLKLTYEATMARTLAWRTMELGAMTIFTVHALQFMEQGGFARRPADPIQIAADQFASENGLHAHHVPHPEGEVYLRSASEDAFKVVLVRKGAWKGPGHATLSDPSGGVVQRLEFPREAMIFQQRVIDVPRARPGTYRLALRAPAAPSDRGGSLITWDVVTSAPMPAVLATPAFQGLEYVTPRLFTKPKGDATKIELELTGEGEGFKKAVLYDPDGNSAATLEAFIDLGDKGRYEYKLTAEIPPRHRDGLWSIALQDVSLTKLGGFAAYFATSQAAFFRPDREE